MMVLGQILLGWFVIDFITGVYHWAVDHWPKWMPVLQTQAAGFQEHHDNPHSMERWGFWFRNWENLTFSTPGLLFAWLWPGWAAFWLTLWVGGSIAQTAHHWAHVARPPLVGKLLQQLGIFITHEAHMRHHRDFERSYGVLNGWSHGTLDLILGRRY